MLVDRSGKMRKFCLHRFEFLTEFLILGTDRSEFFLDALPRLKPWDSGVTNVLCHLAMVLRELLPLDSTLPRFIAQVAC